VFNWGGAVILGFLKSCTYTFLFEASISAGVGAGKKRGPLSPEGGTGALGSYSDAGGY
jgi:hypothetical protein